jgi:hypothetical protein
MVEHLCLEELENDSPMLLVNSLKMLPLPPLAFIAAKVEDIKSAVRLSVPVQISLQFDKTFSASMDGKAAQVGHYPATAEAFGNRAGSARTAEEIGY